MDAFLFWMDLLSVGAQGILQILFVGKLTKKKVRIRKILLYLVWLESIEILSRFREFGSGPAVGLAGILLWGISRFSLGNGGLFSGVAAILAVSVTQLSFGLTNAWACMLFPAALGRIPLTQLLLGGASVFALVLNALGFWLIGREFDFPDSGKEPYIRLLLPSSLFFLASELYILRTAYGQVEIPVPPGETGRQLVLFGLQVLGLCALFGALHVYREACASFRAREALAALAFESRAQKTYVEEARAREQKTRSFRHDIRNHLSVVDGLLQAGQWERARAYLGKLNAVSRELSSPISTGNPAVDILLRDKGELARAEGIRTEVFLSLPKIDAPDWDLDLCVIAANALDNAIQACREMREDSICVSERTIEIRGEGQGDFYLLTFENPCKTREKPVFGTGLSNIRAAAEKYGGTMTAEVLPGSEGSGAVFRLDVLLNLSLRREKRSEQNG